MKAKIAFLIFCLYGLESKGMEQGNENLEGYKEYSLLGRGFNLYPQHWLADYMYKNTVIYKNINKKLNKKYISFKFGTDDVLQFITEKKFENGIGNLGSFVYGNCYLGARMKGKNRALLWKLLHNCTESEKNGLVNTDNLLQRTGLVKHKYAALGYTSLGVALTVSGFYLWNWWKLRK